MNIRDILLIIIIIYLVISHSKKNNIENFAVTDDIRSIVKEIYNTDMEAVRQLAKMAEDLRAGGIKIPGNLIVTGTITSTGDISSASHSLSGLNTSITETNTALGKTNANLTATDKALATTNTDLEKITTNFSGYEFKPVCFKQTDHISKRATWDYDTACNKNANINEGWNLGGFTTILPVKSKYQ